MQQTSPLTPCLKENSTKTAYEYINSMVSCEFSSYMRCQDEHDSSIMASNVDTAYL